METILQTETPFDPMPAEESGNVEASADQAAEAQASPSGEAGSEAPAHDVPSDAGPIEEPATAATIPASTAPAIYVVNHEVQRMQNELNTLIFRLGETRDESKRVSKAWAEKVKALETQIEELNTKILDATWEEEFDYSAGIVHRSNRVTGAQETRPLGAAERQLELRATEAPMHTVAQELEGVTVGLYGETEAGVPFRVQAIAPDSVVVEFADGRTTRVSAGEWASCAPSPDIDPQEYVDAFVEARNAADDWHSDVLAELGLEPKTFEDICESLANDSAWDDEKDNDSVLAALERLISAGKVVQHDTDPVTYSLARENDAEVEARPAPPLGAAERQLELRATELPLRPVMPELEGVSLAPKEAEQEPNEKSDADKLLDVADSEGMTVDELAEASGLPKARVKELCAELVTAGNLAQGSRETGKRGRKPTIFSITEKGRE